MFLPYFIAILLGLINPSSTNHSGNCNGNNTTVSTSSLDEPGNPGGDTGGETGHVPLKP